MRRIRPVLSGLLVAGFLLGVTSLPGCGNPEEGSAPKLKGKKTRSRKPCNPVCRARLPPPSGDPVDDCPSLGDHVTSA